MVLGPEQVTTKFHNYMRSSVTKFRVSQSESMSPGVIGGVGHRGHRWCRSPGSTVVQVIGDQRWCKSPGVIGRAHSRGYPWCIIVTTLSILFCSTLYFWCVIK